MRKKIVLLFALSVLLTAPGCQKEETEVVSSEYSEGDPEYDLSDVEGTYTLTVQTHEPEYAVSGTFLEEWAESIESASGGHIELDINYGAKQGGAKDTAYMVKNGVVDIGWGLQYYYQFPVTEVFMLPLMDIDSAQQGSEALWEFWTTTDYMDEEYSDYHVLLLHTGAHAPIAISGEKVETASGFGGNIIGTDPDAMTSFVQKLGMIQMNVSDKVLYSDLEEQSVDACIKAWDMLDFLSVDPVVSYYLDEDIGVYTYYILMNPDSYSSLPEVLQQIIDDKSEEAIAYTTVWDDAEQETKEKAGDKVYQLEDSERENLTSVAAQAAQDWIASMDELGYDGQAIYDAAIQCIENTK